ncbi:hypothetical protein C8R47DRAFT_40723 [Mycena vitilis]|nr:hypothetical protein C8R47DRAFT_40723 [Mycena vitilis]
MDSHSDSAASINPYPTDWSRWCSKCRTPSLKPPRLCKGNGKDIYNFGRHYQPCENTDCDEWLWNNPPTPLDRIPYDVQLRFTVRKSAAEDSESGILCVAEGCRTRAKNEPRKANVACGRPFPHSFRERVSKKLQQARVKAEPGEPCVEKESSHGVGHQKGTGAAPK